MARGRLVSRTLGSSRKFAALQSVAGKLSEFSQALYPLLIANSDDFGRMAGDAFTVRLAVFPSSPRKDADFAAAIGAMHKVGLVCWYEADGQQVIQIVDFDEHQPGLSKRTRSRFPGPPVNSTEIPSELNRTEEKGKETKRTAPSAADEAFAEFWQAYPKKRSKSDAERAWRKLAPSPFLCRQIQDAIAAQRNTLDWQKDDGRFVPFPATWLNGRRWEDEPGVTPAPQTLAVVVTVYAHPLPPPT